MINDTIDFDYTINKIKQNTRPTVYLQSNVLNSDNLNNSFKDIEETLNTLYEKTRYLEDAIAYTRTFLETRINDFHNNINSVLHEIEDTADSAKNLSYISYNVPFVNNTKTLIDRDNITSIRPLIIRNNNLTLDYLVDKEQVFSMWSRLGDFVPYKDNLKNVKTEPYRAVYLEEKLPPLGVSETIYVYFKEPTLVNCLNIKPVNCEVKNLKFGLVNGVEELVGDYTVNMPIDNRVCTYIKFDLVCKNYDALVYTLDKALMTDNLWSKLQEFEYNQMSNIESKFDASVILSKTVTSTSTGEKRTIAYNSKENKTTTNLKMYSYVFGVDEFDIKNSEYYTDGYMISDPITIGELKAEEYIRLAVKHTKNDCCEISYAILDGDREIPIAIMEEDWIENELIFGSTDTRFEMDFDSGMSYEGEIIKKNGATIETSYIDAKAQALESSDRFSVSYKPNMDYYNYKPLNKTIRVKCYIRTFGKVKNVPYISSIAIRKYGEESLWINRF